MNLRIQFSDETVQGHCCVILSFLLLTQFANIPITVFQAASTPLNPLSFQCGFVKLRIDLLQAFSQLICTCNSLKTSPPPAIATTIAMTSGNDLQRCGRISNQACAPSPLLCGCVCDSGMNFASQQTYLTKEMKSSSEVVFFESWTLVFTCNSENTCL